VDMRVPAGKQPPPFATMITFCNISASFAYMD
jgi:hypothetical protein